MEANILGALERAASLKPSVASLGSTTRLAMQTTQQVTMDIDSPDNDNPNNYTEGTTDKTGKYAVLYDSATGQHKWVKLKAAEDQPEARVKKTKLLEKEG